MKTIKGLLVASFTVATMASTQVVADAADDAIKYRQGVFQAYKWHFGTMGGMLRGKIPYDSEKFQYHANAFSALAPLAAEGFVPGSDGLGTEAKDELWENLDDVKDRFSKLSIAAENLAKVAQAGEINGDLKAAFGAVGKSCKGCHDDYREE